MHRKTVFGVLSGIILVVLLAAFVMAQRSYRTVFVICAIILLVSDCIIFFRKKLHRIIGILLSSILAFVLLLCTAPGIMKPIFQRLEELRFSLARSVYEKDIAVLKTGLAFNINQDRDELVQAENHLKFFASDVLIRQRNEHVMVVYITEWDSYSGYAWFSDQECQTEWMMNFTEKSPAEDNWYYVRIY